jgi:hypothetical protein
LSVSVFPALLDEIVQEDVLCCVFIKKNHRIKKFRIPSPPRLLTVTATAIQAASCVEFGGIATYIQILFRKGLLEGATEALRMDGLTEGRKK